MPSRTTALFAAGAKVRMDDSVTVVQRTKIHPRPHPLSALVALRLISRQVRTTPALFLTMAPSSVGVAMSSANWVTVPRHPVPHRRRRFHLADPQSPLKQVCTSPVLCLTTDLFRVGVKITKGNWAEATRTPQAISLKEHLDLPFQCLVAVQLSQWTSAITWSVVC